MSKAKYQLNKEIEQFVLNKAANYSQDEIAYVNQYIGYGGMWKYDAELEKERGLYEYYTPVILIEKMVGLARKHGFKDGKILEPSCGIGRILHYFPPTADLTACEPDKVSYHIAKANFSQTPSFKFVNSTFNEKFVDRRGNAKPFLAEFNLVIGNPPYGAFRGRHTSLEKEVTKATTYVEYFISRGLDVLKKGGLLIYVIPSAYIDGSSNPAKEQIHNKGDLLDAYRLPIRMFEQTDVQTDIVIYQKK